jgi:hypothetical protein
MSKPMALAVEYKLAPSMNKATFSRASNIFIETLLSGMRHLFWSAALRQTSHHKEPRGNQNA